MKNQITTILLLAVLVACSPNKDVALDPCGKKWQLIEMTGNIASVPPSTGNDMDWQEYYVLNSNGTFLKSRLRDNVLTEESGVYAMVTLSDGQYLELTYATENALIGNCIADLKEVLKFVSDDILMGTWSACDGPGLKYQKMPIKCPKN